jgi:syntaxin 1A/syntaxin 1B/2/3
MQTQTQSSLFLDEQLEEEIIQLEQDLGTVNEIFKDMLVIVKDQSEIVDNIAYNIEKSLDHTDQGVLELQKAKHEQTRGCQII